MFVYKQLEKWVQVSAVLGALYIPGLKAASAEGTGLVTCPRVAHNTLLGSKMVSLKLGNNRRLIRQRTEFAGKGGKASLWPCMTVEKTSAEGAEDQPTPNWSKEDTMEKRLSQ